MIPEDVQKLITELQGRKAELQRLIFETQALLGKIDAKIQNLSAMNPPPRPAAPPPAITAPMTAPSAAATGNSNHWQQLLAAAEQSDHEGNLSVAEKSYAQAVEAAQNALGPYDVNVAQCLIAYANFLEARNRYEEALLRFKLAGGIYKKSGNIAAQTLAAGKVARMEFLVANGLNSGTG